MLNTTAAIMRATDWEIWVSANLVIKSTVAPLAILSAPFDGRPPCTNRGFCNQGCMPNAKYSALIHHIPKAIACPWQQAYEYGSGTF